MTSLNIFQCIENTTRRIEPFHSQFLGDALKASLKGDRTLFDGVWRLCAPADWNPPQDAKVKNEFKLDGGHRIDILIKDIANGWRVGIEVKTSRASARPEQLKDYLKGLRKKYDDGVIAIAYLTPFNRPRAEQIIQSINASRNAGDPEFQGDVAALSTVKEFEKFKGCFDRAKHVSWLEVADIVWDGGEIWHQHQSYVRNQIASPEKLKTAFTRNRLFGDFFSEKAFDKFWNALPSEVRDRADGGVDLDLGSLGETFEAAELARALTILIQDDESVAHGKSRNDQFDEELRRRFLDSEHRKIHEAIFDLSHRFEYVWVQGVRNYGLRVAHKHHSSGVSVVTSRDESRLIIGGRR